MKKLVLIVLTIIICVSVFTTDVVLAKVSFGGWNRWDEEFPPKSYWKDSLGFLREILYLDTKAPFCIAMNRYMENKKGERVSIILFSPFGEDSEDILKGTGDYQFALVAFLPDSDKNMITIRAYKKGKSDSLNFLEEWKIPYENDYSIFKKENKFTAAFKEWAGTKVDIKLIVFEGKKKFTLLFGFEAERKDVVEYLKKAL